MNILCTEAPNFTRFAKNATLFTSTVSLVWFYQVPLFCFGLVMEITKHQNLNLLQKESYGTSDVAPYVILACQLGLCERKPVLSENKP